MRIRTDFPHETVREDLRIPLPDGVALHARLWRPVTAAPVPALLEYAPDRLTDASEVRDGERHPWYAGNGFASVRVDVRGHGNSDGVPGDECGAVELADGVAVVEWLARQPWCSGRVGMFGVGPGGRAALQIAALAPAPLRAVVAVCASDDPYDNGGPLLGGAVTGLGLHGGGAVRLAHAARPPDPRYTGGRWRRMWLSRLAAVEPATHTWLTHRRRDAYWQSAGVGDDTAAVRAAVLAVGGLHDPGRDSVPRLVERLPEGRVSGLVGPWPHGYPDRTATGPDDGIGFLQETLRWWERWLTGGGGADAADAGADAAAAVAGRTGRGADAPDTDGGTGTGRTATDGGADAAPGDGTDGTDGTGRTGTGAAGTDGTGTGTSGAGAAWPGLRYRPGGGGAERPGWAATAWPSPRVTEVPYGLGGDPVLVASPPHTGVDAGAFRPSGQAGELPPDQREEDARSVCFEFPVGDAPLTVLGRPRLTLRLRAPGVYGQVAARLCDVAPDGASRLVTRGAAPTTAPDGDAPAGAVVGAAGSDGGIAGGTGRTVEVTLSLAAHVFAPGHRIRLAVSSAYWPWLWPEPGAAGFTVEPAGSLLALPVLGPDDGAAGPPPGHEPDHEPEQEPEHAAPPAVAVPQTLDAEPPPLLVTRDVAEGLWTLESAPRPHGTRVHADGLEYTEEARETYTIREADPLSARAHTVRTIRLHRPDAGWDVRVRAVSSTVRDADGFLTTDELICHDGEEVVFHRTWQERFPSPAS